MSAAKVNPEEEMGTESKEEKKALSSTHEVWVDL